MADEGAKVRWVPLESNPELFNSWASNMGLDTSRYAYVDVYGLDDALLDMVPSPTQAVLMLFTITESYEAKRRQEDEKTPVPRAGEGGAEGELLWFKQTIGNACGTIGLLHSLANTDARRSLETTSPLSKLLSQAIPLDVDERAALLTRSRELATTHAAAASSGQTAAPSADAPIDLHFVCFVRHPQRRTLVELDGRRRGPVERTEVEVASQADLLKRATAYIQENYMATNPESHLFNLIALAPAAPSDG